MESPVTSRITQRASWAGQGQTQAKNTARGAGQGGILGTIASECFPLYVNSLWMQTQLLQVPWFPGWKVLFWLFQMNLWRILLWITIERWLAVIFFLDLLLLFFHIAEEISYWAIYLQTKSFLSRCSIISLHLPLPIILDELLIIHYRMMKWLNPNMACITKSDSLELSCLNTVLPCLIFQHCLIARLFLPCEPMYFVLFPV